MIYTDQLVRNIELNSTPKRIVSVVPSQTEFLYDLGLENEIVGQTIFCVHPQHAFKSANKIGGTKKLHLDKIRELQPDVIFANKEENDKDQIEILSKEFPVWISDIFNLEDALDMMRSIGDICGKIIEADTIIQNVQAGFAALNNGQKSQVSALYLIWREPYMAAGRNTFISEMMQNAGVENIIPALDSRYPELNSSQLVDLNPDWVLLSSEPYPFADKHIQEIQQILPNAKVELVDGEMFSWYGSRLQKAPGYFATLFDKLNEK